MNSEQLIKNIEILSVNKGVNKTNALVECGAGKNFISNLLKVLPLPLPLSRLHFLNLPYPQEKL